MYINNIENFYLVVQLCSCSKVYFDFKQFLNIPDEETVELFSEQHSCKSTRRESKGKCCSCEPNCMKTKTCCIDAFWNSTYISRQEDYIQDFLTLSQHYKDQECAPIIPNHYLNGTISSYYMVTSCQEINATVTRELKDKCMMGSVNGNSIDYYIPVKGNDDYLYRNKHCAVCNSVPKFEMVQLEKGCGSETCQIRLSKLDKDCKYGENEINKTCSRNSSFFNLCRAFSGPMGEYANYFCHLCNHGYTSEQVLPVPVPPVLECKDDQRSIKPIISWASLLKFDFTDKVDQQCKIGTVLDGKNQKCTSFLCPDGYQAENSNCVALKVKTSEEITVKESSFDTCLLARKPNVFIKDTLDYQKVVKVIFPTLENDALNETVKKIGSLYFIDWISIRHFSIKFAEDKKDKIISMLAGNESAVFSPGIVNSIIKNRLIVNQIFPKNMICAHPIPIDTESLDFSQNCSAIIGKQWIPFSNLSLHMIVDKNGLTRKAFKCNEFYLSKPCPRKVLNKNHTTLNDTKLVILKDGANRIYELHEYAPYKNGGYTICIDNSRDMVGPPWLSTVDEISAYLSIVGSSLSVFCYLLLIATVLQFGELRNVPGLCTLALSINLLFGDGLFLTSNFMQIAKYNNTTTLCDIIGISIHFFLLSAQLWGLVMAIDISVNLKKMRLSSQNNKLKFIWYNIPPILFAATLVTIALLFRAHNVTDVSYNKGGICVLHGFYSRVFLYFLPLLCCFVVSIVSLTISIGYIAKERRKSKGVLKGSTKNNTSMIRVALKLVILCGLTEGIGIVYIPTKKDSPEAVVIVNSIFAMLYSLVKGFRGVMLFIVFICRKPVYEMYRRRYVRNDLKCDGPSSNSIATATM